MTQNIITFVGEENITDIDPSNFERCVYRTKTKIPTINEKCCGKKLTLQFLCELLNGDIANQKICSECAFFKAG